MESYQKAAEFPGSDVFINSTVAGMGRSCPQEVRVALHTPAGLKLVVAKKMLSTIPPMLGNLSGYDILEEEMLVLRRVPSSNWRRLAPSVLRWPDSAPGRAGQGRYRCKHTTFPGGERVAGDGPRLGEILRPLPIQPYGLERRRREWLL
ncbi:hypothetical protein GGS23DRAFT_558797 [Durotheca rogersii]|uniref:uncharacterized protein n=1 Tax=Durotheca rogersii TaxID=419775 RepID=UPI002220BABE|nr:uncharacterized protein GGS23DRAFT_558797 [Durotheca rogersii]KAI5865346.1 hypothetical protein GGS23DRAFT_558797 [Durotheca rogersii]